MRFLSFLLLMISPIKAETQHYKPILVKATRTPSLGAIYQYNSTILTQKDMEHQQFNQVLEALQTAPGVTVVQSGTTGSQTTVFTRGTNGNHTQVRLDGMRANDPGNANGSFNYAELNTDGLEQSQLLRGAQSSLYGSNALGGVLLNTTRQGAGKPRADLEAEFGSFRTFREQVDLQGQHQWVKLAVSTSRFDSKGITIVPKKYRVSTFRQKPDPYHQTSVNSRLDLTSPSSTSLTLFNRFSQSRDHFRTQGAPSHLNTHFQLHRAVVNHEIGESWQHHIGVGYLRTSHHTYIKNRKPNHSDGERLQIDWHHELALHERYKIKLLAEGEKEHFSFRNSTQHNKGSYSTYALRCLQELKLTERWLAAFGISKDWNSKFYSPINYRLTNSYTIAATHTTLHGSLGTGFKAPSLYELYGDSPFFRANPKLKPEKSLSWDLGVEQQITKDIHWNITYFHNKLRNIIESNRTYTQLINHGKAHTYGVESTLIWAIMPCLKSIMGYTWLRTENEQTRHALMRRPKNKVTLTILYQTQDIKTGISVLYSSRSPDFHPSNYSKTHRPSFLTVRLFSEQALTDRLKAHARVENALNRHYQDPLGYQKPGVAVYAGLKYTLS